MVNSTMQMAEIPISIKPAESPGGTPFPAGLCDSPSKDPISGRGLVKIFRLSEVGHHSFSGL